MDRTAAAAAIDAFLRALGRSEPDVVGTGNRVAEMFAEDLCSGYEVDTRALVAGGVLEGATGGDSLVIVRDVPVVTTCPHHLVPSVGSATVAFRPLSRIIGLGTVAALVDAHARRLTLQERIGEGVVADLDAGLAPRWVGCRIVLAHACMIARGERAVGSTAETVVLRAPSDASRAACVEEAHLALGLGRAGRS